MEDFNPFGDEDDTQNINDNNKDQSNELVNDFNTSLKNNIIIKSDQRNARKYTTTIINFPESLDSKEFISLVKKKCQCNGSLILSSRKNKDKIGNIEFSGNKKNEIKEILLNNPYNISSDMIMLQGV